MAKVHGTKTFTRRRGGGGGRRRRTNCYARTREEEEEEDVLLLTLQKCFVDINRPPEDADKVVEILRENWFDDIDALISREDESVLVKPEEWVAMKLSLIHI